MYQVHIWNRTFWDDSAYRTIYTTEYEAKVNAIWKSVDFGDMSLYCVMEDGQDVPYTIIYAGREFALQPESNETLADYYKKIGKGEGDE